MPLDHYVTLGRSGLRVSPFCLGAMTFGQDWGWGSSPEESTRIFDHYAELGGNFVDTANVYTKGHSEKIIGDHLKNSPSKRQRMVIATKFFGSMLNGDPNSGGAGRKALNAACEESLRRLQTDFIDLYWMHCWDRFTPVEETMRALDDLVAQGLVRYVGVSNWEAWKIVKANGIADNRGWTRIETTQVYYSIAGRDLEQDIVPMMADQQIGCLVWSPLAGGYLAGKYTPGGDAKAEPGRRATFDFPPIDKDVADRIVVAMREVAKAHGVSVARVALAWVRQKPFVTSTIIGAKTLAQLNDNLEAVTLTLSPEEIAKLDEVSADRAQYPHWMIKRNNATRVPTGEPVSAARTVTKN